MPGSSLSRRYVLPSALLVFLATALVPTIALADPPPHPTPPAHSHAGGNGAAKGNGTTKSTNSTKSTATPKGKAKGSVNANGGVGNANGNGNAVHAAAAGGRAAADPPGNNGTVKIKGIGDLGTIPNNVPHPGCDFQVMWYGFDQGANIVSTVSFAMQGPTRDVGLTVAGPTHVFVGGDPASGAGTPTGLDGSATYHLTFAGAPHNKQGYHVRLTVHTPFSLGNDTKTKVFWVSACGSAPTTSSGSGSSSSSSSSTSSTSTPRSTTPGTVSAASSERSGVPTSVEAGADRTFPTVLTHAWHGTALPLLVLVVGGLLAVLGLLLRRRAHGPVVRL